MVQKKKQEPSLKLLPKLEREVNTFLTGLPGKEKLEMAFLKGFKQGTKKNKTLVKRVS